MNGAPRTARRPARGVNGAIARVAAMLVVAGGAAGAAAAQTLENGVVRARFGTHGLRSLNDDATRTSYEFKQDHFAVTLDGVKYDSTAIGAPQRVVTRERIGYRWIAGPFQIDVVYELQPFWRFVTKQIVVAPIAERATFRVDEVVVFRNTLSDRAASIYIQPPEHPNLGLGNPAVAMRLDDRHGLLALAQNPFLAIAAEGDHFSVSYKPEMAWRSADGPFFSDRGILAPYRLSGRVLPARMIPEWQMSGEPAPPGMDAAEVAAFTAAVHALMPYRPERPLNLFVGWCVNDYQIDIATEAGRAEYKRVIDRAAELGAEHVLFAPTNSALARRDDSTDDWSWENLLWLGLGQKIRRNEWDPKTGEVPPSVREMLEYARSRRVSLVAYVYPVLAFTQNPEWLVTRPNASEGARKYASLGFRSLQDWLIETLVAFRQKTGISGYAFDHTFLNLDGPSRYAQWFGWRRVMETLRTRVPDIVIDGRQAYHLYGPWTWLSGNYPHPTYSDEQPESFTPFPDLSFDRVSAARERYTAYRYRNYDYAPAELVPGFITHQTSRSDDAGEMPQRKTDGGIILEPFRVRDWDYLGWRYSLLSSIAVAGWNNVLNMIPARDPEEYRHFSSEDKAWFRRWIEFARLHRELLRHTRTIGGEPAIGRIDGTAAVRGNHGYVFLFNPNGRRLQVRLALDDSLGLVGEGLYHVEERYPVEGRRIGKPAAGFWTHGETLQLLMDGHSAMVLEIQPAASVGEPMLFNVSGNVSIEDGIVSLTNVSGEPGSYAPFTVMVPTNLKVKGLRINGAEVPFTTPARGIVEGGVQFEGTRFTRAHQVGAYDPAFAGGAFKGSFTVPRRIFDQLAARQKAWPIPWTAEDLRTPWLAPHRLLLYVQVAEPDERWEAKLTIDGAPVPLTKAYSAVRRVPRTFVGFYADVSSLAPDREHTLELHLPPLKPGQFQGVFFENVEPEYTTAISPSTPGSQPKIPAGK
ncbi:MAG TPA: hypothetical protein VK886_20600 [Vicinamibacterales bacterium]|nr:hypothetical protein [Vicinamibacterales bacterium]